MLKQPLSHTKCHRNCQYIVLLRYHRISRCGNLLSSHPSSTLLQQAELVEWVLALGLGWGLVLVQGLVSALDLVLVLELGTDLRSCVRSRPAASPENQTIVLLLELQAQSFACPKNLQSHTWNRSVGKLHQTAMSESNRQTRLES